MRSVGDNLPTAPQLVDLAKGTSKKPCWSGLPRIGCCASLAKGDIERIIHHLVVQKYGSSLFFDVLSCLRIAKIAGVDTHALRFRVLAEHIEKNQLWGDHGVSFISRMVLGLRANDVYNAALKDQFIMAFPQGGRTQSSAARETAAAELSANDNALLRLLTETLRKVTFLFSLFFFPLAT